MVIRQGGVVNSFDSPARSPLEWTQIIAEGKFGTIPADKRVLESNHVKGEIMMNSASVRGSRRGRLLAVLSALLATVGLTAALDPGAEAKAPPATTSAKPAVTPAPSAGLSGPMHYEQVRIIDERIEAEWQANKVTPSPRCTDHEFIRRASLDIIGRIAKPQEIEQFLRDPPATRRQLLIARLLDNEDYAKNWANIWTTWLMTRGAPAKYRDEMQSWLEEQFSRKNMGWDKIVTALLTATGKTDENGAVNFVLSHLGEPIPPDKQRDEGHNDFVPLTSRTTRLFLGTQTQCTQCHDHPFHPELAQVQFWGMNAFFRQVKGDMKGMMRRGMEMPELNLADDPNVNKDSAVFYEERRGTVRMTKARFIDGTKYTPEPGKTRRQELAHLITTNPLFQKAFANRMWGHFFGRGFTNPGPVDDFGEHNPLTHPFPENSPLLKELSQYGEKPVLLDYIANEFKSYSYDPRLLITWICNSQAYNLSSAANSTNEKAETDPLFARMGLKAMSPEELYESLVVATQAEASGTKESRKNLREAWMKNLIVNFGDDEGNEVTFNGTVVQALMLMNGKEINEAISSDKGTVAQALRRGRTPQAIMADLYLTALNRLPTPKELQAVSREITFIRSGTVRAKTPVTLYQDVFWALLNSNEFILNH